jgi:hypothetical protein
MKINPTEQMTFHGFNAMFEAEAKYLTLCEAYTMTEYHHEVKYGHRRYSSYDSFRKLRERKIKDKTI